MIFVTFGDGLDRIVDGFRRHYNAPEEYRISMADFPDNWALVRALEEGGQGQTFVVRRADGSDLQEYVLKRLKNPNREEYFEREIQACETLDHPNVLRVLEHGRTPRGKRYLVTEYCKGGTLGGDGPRFDNPGDGLRFFRQIVAGVAHAHSNVPAVYHLDLKPENIFLKDGAPVIGDFGICFIAEDELSITKEGMRGSKYYCAPEFRNPKIEGNPRPESADVYSLGKILYWLFAREVYDGHEEDYVASEKSRLASLFTTDPRFAFIDELIAETVRRSPAERIANASLLFQRVQQVVDRIEAGGRVLDLRVPQRCLYCAVGHYRAGHDLIHTLQNSIPAYPDAKRRKNPPTPTIYQSRPPDIYESMKGAAKDLLAAQSQHMNGAPLLLVCDFCGNVQYFRFDLTKDKQGLKWLP